MTDVPWQRKILGETGGGVYGNPLCYLCNFSLNLKLFQNKNTYFKMSYMIVVGKKGNERIKTEKKEREWKQGGKEGNNK